jgi:hypothetical protein
VIWKRVSLFLGSWSDSWQTILVLLPVEYPCFHATTVQVLCVSPRFYHLQSYCLMCSLTFRLYITRHVVTNHTSMHFFFFMSDNFFFFVVPKFQPPITIHSLFRPYYLLLTVWMLYLIQTTLSIVPAFPALQRSVNTHVYFYSIFLFKSRSISSFVREFSPPFFHTPWLKIESPHFYLLLSQ